MLYRNGIRAKYINDICVNPAMLWLVWKKCLINVRILFFYLYLNLNLSGLIAIKTYSKTSRIFCRTLPNIMSELTNVKAGR